MLRDHRKPMLAQKRRDRPAAAKATANVNTVASPASGAITGAAGITGNPANFVGRTVADVKEVYGPKIMTLDEDSPPRKQRSLDVEKSFTATAASHRTELTMF